MSAYAPLGREGYAATRVAAYPFLFYNAAKAKIRVYTCGRVFRRRFGRELRSQSRGELCHSQHLRIDPIGTAGNIAAVYYYYYYYYYYYENTMT